MHTLATLERLSRNPHYKMTKKQLEELEKYRAEQFKQRNQGKPVKHNTSFVKHDPNLEEEKGSHAGKSTN